MTLTMTMTDAEMTVRADDKETFERWYAALKKETGLSYPPPLLLSTSTSTNASASASKSSVTATSTEKDKDRKNGVINRGSTATNPRTILARTKRWLVYYQQSKWLTDVTDICERLR
jgi:hypothetical protein